MTKIAIYKNYGKQLYIQRRKTTQKSSFINNTDYLIGKYFIVKRINTGSKLVFP